MLKVFWDMGSVNPNTTQGDNALRALRCLERMSKIDKNVVLIGDKEIVSDRFNGNSDMEIVDYKGEDIVEFVEHLIRKNVSNGDDVVVITNREGFYACLATQKVKGRGAYLFYSSWEEVDRPLVNVPNTVVFNLSIDIFLPFVDVAFYNVLNQVSGVLAVYVQGSLSFNQLRTMVDNWDTSKFKDLSEAVGYLMLMGDAAARKVVESNASDLEVHKGITEDEGNLNMHRILTTLKRAEEKGIRPSFRKTVAQAAKHYGVNELYFSDVLSELIERNYIRQEETVGNMGTAFNCLRVDWNKLQRDKVLKIS